MWYLISLIFVPVIVIVLLLKVGLWFSDRSEKFSIKNGDLNRFSASFLLTGIIVSIAMVMMAFNYSPTISSLNWENEITEDWVEYVSIESFQEPEVIEEKPAPKTIVKPIDKKPEPKVAPVVNVITEPVYTPEPVITSITEPTPEVIVRYYPPKTETTTTYIPYTPPVVESTPTSTVVRPGISTTSVTKPKTKKVINYAEIMPQFPGGQSALAHFINQYPVYGGDCLSADTEGTISIAFVINEDGSVSHVELKNGLHCSADDMAVDIIENMPFWIPGKQDGENVRVRVVLPIQLSIT